MSFEEELKEKIKTGKFVHQEIMRLKNKHCLDKEKVELIKNVVINEAFMIGRIYSATGEKETPAEIQDILEKKCAIRIKEELGL